MTAEQLETDPGRACLARIGGRYSVEAELGTGGMGVVSRVRDEVTGRVIALKQLRASATRTEEALFQREYHTLALLRHPRIIEVYDYAIVAGRPYYTMELLDGNDLHAASPLPYRDACRHLRDVASSLALLAAHHLVHRDLTARNVRITRHGRAKLIDFGALTPFGTADTVVGTTPYVPPEALRRLPLDQRADLFALGALAYFLLTRTHAYPARRLADLPATWKRRPERPSAVVARLIAQGAPLEPVPVALDDLVLSLLSLTPVARPQNAAEAIERLTRAGGLDPEPGSLAAESYLLSAALVGRGTEVARARELVMSAISKRGGTLSIRHREGEGASRLLDEIALEARLAGATVLQIDGELERAPYAGARALFEKLTLALPGPARAAVPSELDLLDWTGNARSERPPSTPSKARRSRAPLSFRLGLVAALERWLVDVSLACPLVIVADNARELDEATATLLSVLSSTAPSQALAIVFARRADDPSPAPQSLQRLARMTEEVTLEPLSAADTQAFVGSLFGAVPNVDRLTHWAHRISGGNPARLMALARHLVERGIARYADGTWMLPRELAEDDLPFSPEEVADRKLDELGRPALRLASALALHRGRLSLELCIALARAERIDAFAALDELTSSGILVGHESGYRFAQRAMRDRTIGRIPPDETARLHRAIAECLLEPGDTDIATVASAGWHLLSGGEERRASLVLRRVGLQLMQIDQLPEAIPALEAALAVFRKLGRPRQDICALVHHIAAGGYYVERRLADRYGDEALELLAQETGLALARRVRRYVGSYVALLLAMVYALCLHLFRRRGGVRMLSDNISVMGGLTAALVGVSAICLDAEGAERRARHFEAFDSLGLWHAGAFCHALAKQIAALTHDRPAEAIHELRALLERIDTPHGVVGFPDQLKTMTRCGILYALGALEGLMDSPLALERAAALEGSGMRLYDMLSCQVRANYYAYQGNIELCHEYDGRVELHATRSGSTWQAEVWTPSSRLLACKRTRDLIGLKRASEELERLSAEIPSLERYARAARGFLSMLARDFAVAIPIFERLLSESAPRSFIGWMVVTASLAEAYNETGQYERAAELCRSAVAGLSDEDRRIATLMLEVELELAIADACTGRADDAERRLTELLRLHAPQGGAVTLGTIHRAWVEVARVLPDEGLLRYHQMRMEHWYRSTNHPSLAAECERARALTDSTRPRRGQPAEDGETTLEEPGSFPHTGESGTESEPTLVESAGDGNEPGVA